MNLYHIEAPTHGYDVYSDAVVAAETESAAQQMHPGGEDYGDWPGEESFGNWSWVRAPADVTARLIGLAVEGTAAGVICASFHAG